MESPDEFNTVHYCIENNITCFSFPMDKSKKVNIAWSQITPENMKEYINFKDNGFAVITGSKYIVIDYDNKHNPPKEILKTLMDNCEAVETTPGGYHFWYKTDKRTQHLRSAANIKWNNADISGLDIRAKGGIIYTSPSYYKVGNKIKKYEWMKGNISMSAPIPSIILEAITSSDDKTITTEDPRIHLENASVSSYRENNMQTIKIVPKTCECLVKEGYMHSQEGHSCIYITRKKSGVFSGVKSCFSHGKEKLSKTDCETIIEQYWEENEDVKCTEYTSIKEEFEKTNFKIQDPVGFYSNIGGEWRFNDRKTFKVLYENLLLSNGSSFIDLWLKDPSIKTYLRTGFYPNINECPINIFNLFTNFDASKKDVNLEDIEPILCHIKILVDRNIECYDFLLDWFADIIQNPSKLNGIAVIINGQHGCGKDILMSWFSEKILGMHLCYKTSTPQKDIFDTFNNARNNKLLIHIEEANKFVIDNINIEAFKNMITDTYCSIRKMRQDTEGNQRNYNRFILSTNNSDPLHIAETERRFFAVRASSDKCGNLEYFSKLLESMAKPGVQRGFYEYLLKRDINKRNWMKLPQTKYLQEAKLANISNIYHFLYSYIQTQEDDFDEYSRIIYMDYCQWCRQNNNKTIIERDFAMTLKDIDGCEKNRTKTAIKWVFTLENICKTLQSKGFDCSCGKCE